MGGAIVFSVAYTLAIRAGVRQGYVLAGSAVVLASEAVKIGGGVAVCRLWMGKPAFPGPMRWGFAVNAFLYMGTNLLTFAILERIGAGLWTVLAQHKSLLVVAVSSLVFGRQYSCTQWGGCVMLMCGVAMAVDGWDTEGLGGEVLLMVLAQGLCSTVSGVWMEKMMKREDEGGEERFYTFVTDSLQMYCFSLPGYMLLAGWVGEGHTLPPLATLGIVLLGACNGLFVGSVFKYFSAATRAFVQGISVMLVVWVSAWCWGEGMGGGVAVGTALVVGGVAAFGLG